MKMFASKTPRDLNHDPKPWVTEEGVRQASSEVPFRFGRRTYADFDPREHVQHNEPNRILVAFRERGDVEYPEQWWHATVALRTFGGYAEWNDPRSYFHPLIAATDAEARHAGRVFARLERMRNAA